MVLEKSGKEESMSNLSSMNALMKPLTDKVTAMAAKSKKKKASISSKIKIKVAAKHG